MPIIKLLKIALLNIFRNSRRSIITFLAMAVGSATLICLGGFMEYSFQGLRETTIRTQLGHFQVYRKGYIENSLRDPYKYLIKDYSSITKDLAKIYDVDAITQRLSFAGLIAKDNLTFSALFIGVNPKLEGNFTAFESIVDGRQLNDKDKYGAVLGSELAKALNLKIGSSLTVLTNTVDGMINAIDVEVVGVSQSGSKDYDKVFVKIPIDLMQRVLNTSGVEKLLILLNDTDNIIKAEKHLKEILSTKENKEKYEYATWLDLAEYYQGVKNIYTGFFDFVQVTIFIVVFFGIYNTLSMSIFERTKEIGTLRAIGFFKFDIIKMFILEALVLGVIGSILGILLSCLIAYGLNLSGGIYIAPPPGQTTGYVAEILLVPAIIIKAAVMVIVISLLSAIYPSVNGVKKSIVDALGYV